jgi:hypothetical protein
MSFSEPTLKLESHWRTLVRRNRLLTELGLDSTGGCNTLKTAYAEGVLQMKRRPRINYTEEQKALMWERWRAGDNLHQIANLFDRHHTSVQGILVRTGGIQPAQRHRQAWR